jgi:hypothetical protein
MAVGILLRRVLGIGLTWTALWTVFWTVAVTIIGLLHPDSIDSGAGPVVTAATLGPMGLLSGLAFAVLVWLLTARDGRPRVHDRCDPPTPQLACVDAIGGERRAGTPAIPTGNGVANSTNTGESWCA